MPAYRRVIIAAAATVLALVGLPASAAARTVSLPRHYVALGDSYTAGPLIPVQRTDPIGCERSTSNYPALLATALHIRDYTDVSCSNVTTDNMTAPQEVLLGPNPAQFDALRSDTDLVTLTISGNDIEFADILVTCIGLSATDPFGNAYAAALGRDACQLPGVKWVEGTVPTSPAAPVHPNATGMRAVAGFTLDVIRDLDEAATLG
ncbi:MAG: GDSL-type esterase/lipase family protein [Pseudonocardiaceae bacterium]